MNEIQIAEVMNLEQEAREAALTALSSLGRWPLDDGATVSCGWKVFWNPTCQAAQEYILQELASDS